MTGAMRTSGVIGIPRTSNCTSAAVPPGATSASPPGSSGERMFVTWGSSESVWTSEATAASNRCVPAIREPSRLSTSTDSVAGDRKSAPRSICCARAVSPEPLCESVSLSSPTTEPAAIATSTSANQAPVDVFQWAALQLPARRARFCSGTASPYDRADQDESAKPRIATHQIDRKAP